MKVAAIMLLVAWSAVPAIAQQPGATDTQTPGVQTPDKQIPTPDDGSPSSKALEEAESEDDARHDGADERRRRPRFRCSG